MTCLDRRRIITWNTKVGRRPARVLRMLRKIVKQHRPHVIVLQEAAGYVDALHDLPGYDVFTPRGTGEARGNVILVAADIPTERLPSIRCHFPWTGPKAGMRHPGRVFPVAEPGGWTIANVHRTRPGWSHNGAAFAEEHDRLLDLEHTTGPLVIVGDQNIGTRTGSDRARNTPWALAQKLDAGIVTTTPGHIDYAIVRGVDGFAEELGKFGSDHNAVLFTLTAR